MSVMHDGRRHYKQKFAVLAATKEDVPVWNICESITPILIRKPAAERIGLYRLLAEQSLLESGELTRHLDGRKPFLSGVSVVPPQGIAELWRTVTHYLPKDKRQHRDTLRLLAEEALLISGDLRRHENRYRFLCRPVV